jgi:hypothetical protein
MIDAEFRHGLSDAIWSQLCIACPKKPEERIKAIEPEVEADNEEHPEVYIEEMEACVDSVIDDRLYADIDSEKFVQKAIGFEKDALLYFREFLPFLNPSGGNIVEDLIEEEKGHLRKLADMKKQTDLYYGKLETGNDLPLFHPMKKRSRLRAIAEALEKIGVYADSNRSTNASK